MAYTVVLLDGTPWGFRLQGGKEFNEPITIAKINPNSKAYNEGLEVGDFLDTINGDSTDNLMHNEALQLIRNASDRLHLELRRASSNKPIPEANKQENGDINHNVPGYWSGDEGGTRSVSYKPISFGSSPSSLKSSPCTTPSPQRRHQQQQEQHQFFDSQTDVVGREQDHGHDRQENQDEEGQRKEESWTAETPLVWSPYGQKSPSSPRKGYSPIRLHSTGKHKILSSDSSLKPEDTFAWSACDQTTTATSTLTTSTVTTTTSACSSTPSPTWNSTITHISETRSSLPISQSPTITLLQKSRDMESEAVNSAPPPPPPAQPHAGPLGFTEGQLPKGATYIKSEEPAERKVRQTDSYHTLPSQRTTTVTIAEKKVPPEPVRSSSLQDKDTGTPVSPCLKKDETNQKEWYKKMYKTLHTEHKSKSKETNPYRPSYEFPKKWNDSDDTARSLDRYTVTGMGRKGTWSPATARYRNEVYKNQPKSIEDYEPGLSSIALRENKVASLMFNPPIEKPGQYSKYTIKENHSERGFKKTPRPASPASEADIKLAYKMIQKGGEIPTSGLCLPSHKKKDRHGSSSPSPSSPQHHRHSASDLTSPSPSSEPRVTPTQVGVRGEGDGQGTLSQRRRDEEVARRKAEMDRISMEQKQRRLQEEEAANAARRHNDVYLPKQKSPIPPAVDRFEEADPRPQHRPNKKAGHMPRGKAQARYNFGAQNPKELSFKKGDTIYLLRKIDSNWYEGEHHGRVGIFPANYVKVITSLETAHAVAHGREGVATARYNFTPQTSVELPLRKGDEVHLVRQVDDNWYEGRAGGRHGIFPAAYVDIIKEPDTPLGTPMSSVAGTPMMGSPGSTISNGPTIPDGPESPRGFDQYSVSSYGHSTASPGSQHSHQQHQQLHHQHQQQQLQHQQRQHQQRQHQQRQHQQYPSHYQQQQVHPGHHTTRPMQSVQTSSSAPLYSAYNGNGAGTGPYQRDSYASNYSDRTPSYGMPNGHGDGSYGTVGSRDSYSSNRGYREEEPRYPKYRAMYRYLQQNEDELELNEGDTIYVMEKCDDGWFVGLSARTKEFGTFPGNYVQPF